MRIIFHITGLIAVMVSATISAKESVSVRNADIGYPVFKGLAHPITDNGVKFKPGGYLRRVFDADQARGAGSNPGEDFWIDQILAREGTGGGYGDSNNWLFTRGRAAYMYTHQPEQPGFVGEVAYWHKTGHDTLFKLQAEQDGKPLQFTEISALRRQTPSYFSTVFEDTATGVRMNLVKFITHENVAVAEAHLSATDGKPHALTLKALSPMTTHADKDELIGAFQTRNAITTVFPRFSGDNFQVENQILVRVVNVPASGKTPTIKLQLGLTTQELPDSLAAYQHIRAQSSQQTYQQHVTSYNRWWADNLPYLDTPEDNINKSLFYRWWLLRFNSLDADVPGNDYQFPIAIEGVLGYNNAIVLTTGMFIDDLKYLRDPTYAYGSWIGAGEVAAGGKYVDNPGSPENWSSSFTQYITAAAWRAYQLHGGPIEIAGKLAGYGRGDVLSLLRTYDKNGNGLIEYDWSAMTGNDADAVSFDWARLHGQKRMDRTESAYVYANALATAQAARLSGDAAMAREMETVAETIRKSVLDLLWQDNSKTPDSMGLHGNLLKHRQAAGPKALVDWKEINNYYPFAVGLMPKRGEPDYDPKYIQALRLFADTKQYPLFPFYTANQADQLARGDKGSNNFSVINSTVLFRILSSTLRDYPSTYLDEQSYRKLLYWNAWAHYINGDNRYPDQNEFWANGSAENGGNIGYRSWIHHTQLGTTNFTIIEDVAGLKPRTDAKIELQPIDIGWDFFTVDNLRYRDRDLSIIWDRDGSRYGGPAGYSVYLDGQLAFTVDRLDHVVYDPASGQVEIRQNHTDQPGAKVLTANTMTLPRPEQVNFSANTRLVEMLAKAGIDVTLPKGVQDWASNATTSCSYATPGFGPEGAIDGSTANEPFWGTVGSPHGSDWVALDFGHPQPIDDVRLYFYRSSSAEGAQNGAVTGTRAGYAPPWLYLLQYDDKGIWKNVPEQVRDTPFAQGNRNRIRFPPITTQKLRVQVTHAGAARTGIKAIQVYHTGAAAPQPVSNHAPQVLAWLQDGGRHFGALQLSGQIGDDGLPDGKLAVRWRRVDGPAGGEAIIDDVNSAETLVRFTAPGRYRLRLSASDGALTSHADVVVDAIPREKTDDIEIQGKAKASAEYTAGHHRLSALNDGIVSTQTNGVVPADRRWGNWSGRQPKQTWLQYEWQHPVRIASSALHFWNDQPGGGVAPPAAWKLQYRQDGRWIDINSAAGYPHNPGLVANRAYFAPIETTALRALLTAADNAGAPAALGVEEWQVFADIPERLEQIDVRTGIGLPPHLPSEITAWYRDGSKTKVAVTWPTIDADRLTADGRVTLRGLSDGGAIVSATVWVRASEPGQVNTVDTLPAMHTTVAHAPALPDFATVQYNDGSRERRPIIWDAVNTGYVQPGEFTVEGRVAGRGNSGTRTVHIKVIVVSGGEQ
ncbi:carbohydrate-binding protein [Pectobacterium araliae]|uniref:Ig-like domain-containing protein n=1 Tax=Pectobacterium araliae TaxID=3073862 RepID=UPI00208A4DB9|nr:carbohydrate-binding protein [Pectobacterium carotovorum subsp. carotovorum]